MTGTEPTAVVPVAGFVLVLVPTADPQVRHGGRPREPVYRLRTALKVLLRSFGLRCVAARMPQPADPKEMPAELIERTTG